MAFLAAAACLATAAPALADALPGADAPDWPRRFDSPSGSFVIYQPQPEDLSGNVLTGRAAFSVQKSEAVSPIFGVLWFTETIQIDRDSSTVAASQFDVTKVRLPGITSEEASRYETLVEAQASGWDLTGSVEELRAGLAASEKERASVADLDNTPPKILFRDHRAILVVYDGAPLLEKIEGTSLERVLNTPYAVVYEPRSRTYYLNGANLWYRAQDPLGPWSDVPNPPDAVRDVVPPDTTSDDQVEGPPPEVLTATEPTELIATDGPPQYVPLVRDELLYVANTESDVVREVSTQDLYVLLSGRWFRASSMNGPWTFVRGDELPTSFKEISPDSPKGNLLASVAGTDQAEDAIADAEIPQTSAIQRGDHSFAVTYDGDPDFELIEGTRLEYAVNTDAEVILADGMYYACDQGVWYIADDPDGPWRVSETRPVGIEDIPPSCPVYDTRYVYVYDSTPDVVYVGYLPGYLGCYPSYGTVVYGTGYHYRAWRSRSHFYPRRSTWGLYARYNPWFSRWSFGFSYSTGFLRVGSRWPSDARTASTRVRSAWFGPGGYRRPLIAPNMTLLREHRTVRDRTRVADGLQANLYNRAGNVVRVDRKAERIRGRSIAASIQRPAPVPNDVFAGKDGKVYRRAQEGTWQVRTGTGWKPTTLPSPPQQAEVGQPQLQAPPKVKPERRRPQIEPPAPSRSEQPVRPTVPRERSTFPRERRVPPEERRTPPAERPTPGDLEREYHARRRVERGQDRGAQTPAARPAPPSARPTPPSREPQNQKDDEKDKDQRPVKERVRPDRDR